MERVAIVGIGWVEAEAADLAQHREMDVDERYRVAAAARARCFAVGAPDLRETRAGVLGRREPR